MALVSHSFWKQLGIIKPMIMTTKTIRTFFLLRNFFFQYVPPSVQNINNIVARVDFDMGRSPEHSEKITQFSLR